MWSLLLQMSQNLMKTATKHNMFAVIINTEITKKNNHSQFMTHSKHKNLI